MILLGFAAGVGFIIALLVIVILFLGGEEVDRG